MSKNNILIIGGGIAGTSLMWHLLEQDCSVKIIHDSKSPMCSTAASGIINPISGRKAVFAWKAMEILMYCEAFYSKLEAVLDCEIILHREIRRNISNEQELKVWKEKEVDEDYLSIVNLFPPSEFINKESLGTAVSKGLIIDTKTLINKSHQYFNEKNLMIDEAFDFDSFNTEEYSHIIYCNGSQIKNISFFNDIPNKLNKGEALLFKKVDNPQIKEVLKAKTFLIPQSDGDYWVGSFNNWDDKTWNPTEEAFENLAQELDFTFNGEFHYVESLVGLRVGIIDRRPLIGWNKNNDSVGIFNGFGTKGFSLAPFLSNHFCEHLFKGASLWQEINIERFRS